jgi:hypothetical protein
MKESGFNLKIENDLSGNLECRLVENAKFNQKLILHPHLINNLETKFGEQVKKKTVYVTPGIPRFKIVCPDDSTDVIDPNLQLTTVL